VFVSDALKIALDEIHPSGLIWWNIGRWMEYNHQAQEAGSPQ
jgi:hypothetical protein